MVEMIPSKPAMVEMIPSEHLVVAKMASPYRPHAAPSPAKPQHVANESNNE
jgi:hypothetical protein